jgi:hypothetical protein
MYCDNQYDNISVNAQSRRSRAISQGATEMEWEEALLRAWDEEITSPSATDYRRKATRARQIAEGVTTRAVKVRLLDVAAYCDRRAADAARQKESR